MTSRRTALLGATALVSSLLHLPALAKSTTPLPVLFIGHGSPMNAISTNHFTATLNGWRASLPRPTAILVVSAHWLTNGVTGVTANETPPTIHDFSGFPAELHAMAYPAKGHSDLARQAAGLVRSNRAVATHQYGLDHGAWAVLHHLYPEADVPVFQVSVDYNQPAAFHYQVGRELQVLRERGVLVVGSGNIVHNLRATIRGAPESGVALRPWAASFDRAVKQAVDQRDDRALLDYLALDDGARMAVPTPDHYWPFLYALGAADQAERPKHVFQGFHSGTLSMRCLQFG